MPVRALNAGITEYVVRATICVDPVAADWTSFKSAHREGVTKIVNSRVLSEAVVLDANPRRYLAEP